MNFRKLAYAQRVLRSLSDRGFLKHAMVGRMAAGAGKLVWNQAVKHQGALAPVALVGGALGLGAAARSGVNRTRANMVGFDPNVVAARREMGE